MGKMLCCLGPPLQSPVVSSLRVLSFDPARAIVTIQVTAQLSHTHSVQPLSLELHTTKKVSALAVASNLSSEEGDKNTTRTTSGLLETNVSVHCENASCTILPIYITVTYVRSSVDSDDAVVWTLAGQLARPDMHSLLVCMLPFSFDFPYLFSIYFIPEQS